MNTSFWLDAPRAQFSQRCVERFGVDFAGDGSVRNNQHVHRPRRSGVKPFGEATAAQRKRSGVRGSGVTLSRRAMASSGNLIA